MAKGGKEGEVTYTLRADDSHLDADLNSAEKKVEKSAKQTAQTAEKLEKQTAEVQKDIQEDVTDHHIKENQNQEQADDDSYEKREDSAKAHGEKLKSIASGAAKAIGAAMLAVGTAIVGIGVSAVNSANNLDQAMNQFMASTGTGTEEAERYKKVLEDIYVNNYGDSFEDIANAMASVKQQMGDLDSTELQNITEGVFALSDVFETDFNETLRGTDQLMVQFGISSEEALDLLAAGSQAGLNYTDELGDNIAEYGGKFAQAGYSAEEYFQLLKNGTENGAYNLDKVNDAINEITNKIADGSIESSLELFSEGTKDIFTAWQEGGASQKDVIDSIVNDIRNCTNEQEALTMAATAFGTMGEDSNLNFIKSLSSVGEEFDDIEGKMDSLKEVKYDDLGSMFEGLKRAVEVLLLPLGEQLIPLLQELIEDVLPLIEEYLPPLIDMIAGFAEQLMPIAEQILPVLLEVIQQLGEPLMQIINDILPVILDLFDTLAPLLADLIESVLPVLVDLLDTLLPPIMTIIETLLPPLVELIDALMPILQMVIDLLAPIIDLFAQLMEPIAALISEALVPLLDALTPIVDFIIDLLMPQLNVLLSVFQSVFEGIADNVMTYINRVTDILNNVIDFVKNVFTGNWEGAWENIKNIFKNIFGGLKDLAKAPINGIIDILNGFINGLNKIKLPDWVPVIGGKSPTIPNIPKLRVGMDYVPSDDFPALLHKGEAVLTAQENAIYQSAGGFEGLMQNLSSPPEKADTNITVKTDGGNAEIDYERLGQELSKSLDGKAVIMDGKKVGRIVAEYIDYEIGRINTRRT